MINFDVITTENIKEHNPNWPQIADHPQRILQIGASVSGKTNALLKIGMLSIHMKQNTNC